MRARLIAVSIAVSIAGAALPLAACANLETVADAPATTGVSQRFAAPYPVVAAAALEAVQRLNVTVQGADATDAGMQIRFAKGVSAFSWGEVGAVTVLLLEDGATIVRVNASKRSTMQVTGVSERRFAEEIFANIAERLAEPAP